MKAFVLAGVVVVAVVVVGFVVVRDSRPPAERAARDACDHVDAFTRIVEEDGPAARAAAELQRAERKAREAARLDVRYLPLESGVQALRVAIVEDDASAAESGLAVTLSQCEQVS